MNESRWRDIMLLSERGETLYLGYRHNPQAYIVANPEIVDVKPGQGVEVVWYITRGINNHSFANIYHIRLPQVIELPDSLQGSEGSILENRMDLEGRGRWYLVGWNEGGYCEITYPAKELLDFLSQLEELKTDGNL